MFLYWFVCFGEKKHIDTTKRNKTKKKQKKKHTQTHTHTHQNNKIHRLPAAITFPAVLKSDNKNIIFGAANSNIILELSLETGKFLKLGHKFMPSSDTSGHCASYFELGKKPYAFIYGSGMGAHVFECETKKWHSNIQIEDVDFGNTLSMITDCKQKNIIHLMSGEQPKGLYAKIEFDRDQSPGSFLLLFYFFLSNSWCFVVLVQFFF